MRLIDADELLKKAYKSDWEWHDRLHTEKQKVVDVEDIDEAPTIEAEPVKHGHWIEKNDRITCSNCGREVMYNSDYLPQTTHFCYNCGAKMNNGKDFDFNNSLLRSWK